MNARISRKTLVTLALFAAGACKEAPTQTHIVLDVHVDGAIANQVTRIAVHDLKRSGKTNVSPANAAFERGQPARFVLVPGSDRSALRIRIVALHERDEIASATLASHYAAGRGRFLDVELGCEGAYDLRDQKASATPRNAIDSCAFEKRSSAGSGGNGGSGGAAGSGVAPGEPVAGTRSIGTQMPSVSAAGAAAGGTGGGTSGSDGARTGAAGATAGTGGAADSGASGGGSGGTSRAAGASDTQAAGSGGMAGTSAAGVGGAGSSAAGASGSASRAGCFTWFPIAQLTGVAEIEALDPGAYRVGFETRENSLAPMIPQYICQAAPSGTTTKLAGKASKWGCYIPGPGTTAYAVTQNVEILNSSNDAPCLVWKPLIPSESPTSTIHFGSGAGGTTQVCYVEHTGTAEDNATSGPRVGQVRFEDDQYVCRYEFYYSENRNMTLVNLPSEVTRVLDYAP